MTKTLVAGVAAQQCAIDTEAVLGTLRRGVQEVVQPALDIELNWGTFASNQVEDLPKRPTDRQLARHFGSDGLDFDFVTDRWGSGEPASAAFTAESSVMRASWESNPDPERYNPAIYVAEVRATFPTSVDWASRPVGGLRVSVAISQWAMRGSGQRLDWLAEALRTWVAAAADAIGADSGFVALTDLSLKSDDSPWEDQQGLIPAYRDMERYLWGFGWGTLLGPTHVAAVGGQQALRSIAMSAVGLPGDRLWIELGSDPAAVPEERMTALEDALGPALRRADSPQPH